MTTKNSILIIDDHPLFREGLKAIVERDNRFQVVGEAGTGRQGLRKAKQLKPDLAVIDISLPDLNGIQVTMEMRSSLPETRVMIVSMHSKIDYIAEAFQAGAIGYVAKDSASDRLVQGLESVLKGEYYLDSSVSHQVVEKLMKLPVKEAKITDAEYGSLTPREQEVMRLLAEGSSPKEIADKLCISPKTVESHKYNIMEKLRANSLAELTKVAIKKKLIEP